MSLPLVLKQLGVNCLQCISYSRAVQGIKEFKPDFVYERYSAFTSEVLGGEAIGDSLILEVNATYAGEFW